MKTQNNHSIMLIALSCLICSTAIFADPVGTTFTYQGRLLDDNVAAEGMYDMLFTLYDDPNVLLASQVGSVIDANEIEVVDGYFIAELDFGSGAFDGDARWLQIDVRPGEETGDYVPLSPLQPITPAPYALHALNGGESIWQVNGSDIYYNSGKVNIGTSTSQQANLHVQSWEDTQVNIWSSGEDTDARLMFGTLTSGENFFLRLDESDARKFKMGTTSNNAHLTIQQDGNVGIGTTNPLSTLDVRGDIRTGVDGAGGELILAATGDTDQGGQAVWHGAGIYDNWVQDIFGTRMRFLVNSESDSRVEIFNNNTTGEAGLYVEGNVGIGTSSPNASLQVWGGDDPFTVFIGSQPEGNQRLGIGATNGSAGISLFQEQMGGYLIENDTGDLTFKAGYTGAGGEKVRITSGGNVGIGTTEPDAKLEVTGGAIKATGGLIIETRTSDPASPATGQMWLRTDIP